MLVLSRKVGEVITIGSSVRITVLSFDRGIVRLGIEAPKTIPVHRKEIYDKIIDMNRQAAKTELSALKKALSKSNVDLKNNGSNDSIRQPMVKFATVSADLESSEH